MEDSWIQLFNGKDLSGWKVRWGMHGPDREPNWVIHGNVLEQKGHGLDIITDREFGDFELHLEYIIPKDSNSGIYLRGQYEIQILDSYGQEFSDPIENGALYNQKSPDLDASKPAGEWQTMDIILKGLILNIWLNGKKIHDNVIIKGPTGGQLYYCRWERDKLFPIKGPVMLQGNHGPVIFRNICIREF
jgi:hypothetical protein